MNILITDDEPLIHLSIEKLIKTCFETACVFHAYTGHEMLILLETHNFLLAFVDIKMPGLSGLDAIEAARKTAPQTKYYIMSGFDEFEYAKQAIKLKVEDYLLKPLDKKTIQETIHSALQLDISRRRECKTVFRNWLESTLNHRESSLGKYENYYCSLLLITADHPDFPKETLLDLMLPYTDNCVSAFAGDHIVFLCFAKDISILRNIQQQLCSHPKQNGLTLFSSSILHSQEQLKQTLFQLLDYSCLRIIAGIETFYFLKPLTEYPPEFMPFCRCLLDWQKAFREKNYTRFANSCELICGLLQTSKIWEDHKNQVNTFIRCTLDPSSSLPENFSDLKKYFYDHAAKLLTTSPGQTLVHSIAEYLQTHFRNDISIAALSDHFGVSSSYISSLLKQELGIRYNDYITQLRLNYAKELLASTKQSIKEISSACGYYSQSHFTRLFTDHEHCTPTEYRKKYH